VGTVAEAVLQRASHRIASNIGLDMDIHGDNRTAPSVAHAHDAHGTVGTRRRCDSATARRCKSPASSQNTAQARSLEKGSYYWLEHRASGYSPLALRIFCGRQSAARQLESSHAPWWVADFLPNIECEIGMILIIAGMVPLYWPKGNPYGLDKP
jgi:hypothetical protein